MPTATSAARVSAAREQVVRHGHIRDADQRSGVTRKHKAVPSEMPIPDRCRNAGAHPADHAEHVQLGLLDEQRAEHERSDRAHRGPENPIETLGEHHAAERLHQHEHRGHRYARLRQIQQHRNAERQQPRGDRFEQMQPNQTVAGRPVPNSRTERLQHDAPLPAGIRRRFDRMFAFHLEARRPGWSLEKAPVKKTAHTGHARRRL
jgi:hypothetical protein